MAVSTSWRTEFQSMLEANHDTGLYQEQLATVKTAAAPAKVAPNTLDAVGVARAVCMPRLTMAVVRCTMRGAARNMVSRLERAG